MLFNLPGELAKMVFNNLNIEWLVLLRTKHAGEMLRLNFTQQQVAVGHGQWPAIAVTRRAWVSAGGFRPNLEAAIFKLHDRATTRGHGVNIHHRYP